MNEYLLIAMSVAYSISTVVTPSARQDSINHYNKSVGFFEGVERYAVKADSIKLLELYPNEHPYKLNAAGVKWRWMNTENAEQVRKQQRARQYN